MSTETSRSSHSRDSDQRECGTRPTVEPVTADQVRAVVLGSLPDLAALSLSQLLELEARWAVRTGVLAETVRHLIDCACEYRIACDHELAVAQ